MASPGRLHTPQSRAKISAAQYKWTPQEISTLVAWYAERDGKRIDLAGLSVLLGRNRQVLSRKARSLGLTCKSRPTGRKRKAKYATVAEARLAIGDATRKRLAGGGHPRGMLGKTHTPEVMARIRAGSALWLAELTQADRDAITDRQQATKLKRYGRLGPRLTGAKVYSRCKHGRRSDLADRFFRSSWEANYARFLNLLVGQGAISSWEYEADTFWFEKIRRGVRSYTPDFKITEPSGAIYYVEVKGWMDAKSKTKIRRMGKYHPKVDLRVVGEKAYREIERKLAGAIPGWERAA